MITVRETPPETLALVDQLVRGKLWRELRPPVRRPVRQVALPLPARIARLVANLTPVRPIGPAVSGHRPGRSHGAWVEMILHALRRARDPLSAVDLARELHATPSQLRHHLNAMKAEGLIRQTGNGTAGTPYFYSANDQVYHTAA